MKPTKLSRQDVLRRAREVGLKFRVEKRGNQWAVLATSKNILEPIEVGAKGTRDEAQAFVDAMRQQANAMLPDILAQARDTETGIGR